jgi:ribosomal protein S18 acetylase RimI-like enzyme
MIQYAETTDQIISDMLEGFFQNWKAPLSQEKHLAILKNSDYIVLALDTETDKVVGYITALTDHVQSAFIPFLEVLPEYQHQGVGSHLVKSLLEKLQDIPGIDVMCDRDVQPFYARFGMVPYHGMIIRKQ